MCIHVPGPPCWQRIGLRMPAPCTPYVPEAQAQGSLPRGLTLSTYADAYQPPGLLYVPRTVALQPTLPSFRGGNQRTVLRRRQPLRLACKTGRRSHARWARGWPQGAATAHAQSRRGLGFSAVATPPLLVGRPPSWCRHEVCRGRTTVEGRWPRGGGRGAERPRSREK